VLKISGPTPPPAVITVGCAEGYYAVGLARLFPQAAIFAFDTDPKAQLICRQTASLNQVDDRVTVMGACAPPVLLSLLARVGLISAADLASKRRYAIVGIFVFAAVVTPPDVISQCSLAVPMLLSQLDRSFWVVEDLRSLGLPVLGGISMLTSVSWSRRMIGVTGFAIAVIVLIGLYGGLMIRLLRASAVV